MDRTPNRRRALVTLRTTLILTLGVLVALGAAAIAVTTGLGAVEAYLASGSAFAGTVVFLHKIVD
jgi:predicted branched-subunit amino acid permease